MLGLVLKKLSAREELYLFTTSAASLEKPKMQLQKTFGQRSLCFFDLFLTLFATRDKTPQEGRAQGDVRELFAEISEGGG